MRSGGISFSFRSIPRFSTTINRYKSVLLTVARGNETGSANKKDRVIY